MEHQFIIYGLIDPDTKEIRYVGKSSYGLRRPKEHFKPSNYLRQKNHKAHWIKKLVAEGKLPEITILRTATTEEELNLLEIETIKYYRDQGNPLTNGTNGGEGSLGWIPTEETKANMAEARAKYLASLTEPLKAPNKKEHVFVGEIESKICCDCGITKPIVDFGINNHNWDKLHHICKKCNAERTAALRAAKPRQKLTLEQLKQSYEDRKAAMSEAAKKTYENNPEIKEKLKQKMSKPVEGTHTVTGEKIRFNSALEAKAAGFQNSNLGQAIRKNVPYRGYRWKFI